jgi:hypothetical protein
MRSTPASSIYGCARADRRTLSDPDRLATFHNEVPFGDGAWRALEHSSAVVRPAAWRAARRLRPAYRRFSLDLMRSIHAVAACDVIVDTSHYPLRARELRRIPGLEVTLLWLVRDPHGVVGSFQKDTSNRSKSPIAANLYLFCTNLVAVAVFFTHPRHRRLFVSYEELLKSPENVVHAIVSVVGLPEGDLPDLDRLATGVPFEGNRLLQQEVTQLQRELPAARRSLLTAVCQAPWVALAAILRRRAGTLGYESVPATPS